MECFVCRGSFVGVAVVAALVVMLVFDVLCGEAVVRKLGCESLDLRRALPWKRGGGGVSVGCCRSCALFLALARVQYHQIPHSALSLKDGCVRPGV